MYQYLDRTLPELAPVDQFLLSAMRQWVAAARAGRCPCGALALGLSAVQREALLPDLHMAMMLLDRDGQRQLAFRMPGCMSLGDDEALLLALHAAAREGRGAAMEAIAESLVQPEACGPLAIAAARIAGALAA